MVNVELVSTFSTAELNATDMLENIIPFYPVEQCFCPDGFTGPSCEYCDRGYFRPSRDIRDPCVRCDCNNQTLDCDSVSGVCNCTDITKGNNCEQCISGYYGNTTRGIPCYPCSCPQINNSFSDTCILDVDDIQTCDACQPGHTGRNCEVCMDSYFGNPLVRVYSYLVLFT